MENLRINRQRRRKIARKTSDGEQKPPQKKRCSWSLRRSLLSRDNDDSNLAIASAGGIAPLIALVERGTPEAQWSATRALVALTDGGPHVVDLDEYNDEDAIADDAVHAGAIAALVGFARDGTSSARHVVACALSNFGTNDEHRASIAREGAIAPMVAHLHEHGDGAEAAVAVLWMCAPPSPRPLRTAAARMQWQSYVKAAFRPVPETS